MLTFDLHNITSNITNDLLTTLNLTTADLNSTLLQDLAQNEEVQEIVFVVLFVIGICADLVLIYMGLFKPKYRRTPNILLANWALANLLHLITVPVIVTLVPSKEQDTSNLLCFLSQIDEIFKCSEIIFLLFLILSWYGVIYHRVIFDNVKRLLKAIIILLWVVSLCIIPITVGFCMLDVYGMPQYIFDLLYLAMGSLLIKFHSSIVLKTYKDKTDFGHPTLVLNLVSMFAFIWAPATLQPFFGSDIVLSLISELLEAASPILVVVVLFGFEKHFQEYLGKLIQRIRDRRHRTVEIELESNVKNLSVSVSNNAEQL